jgi:formamidopyrimidine-DNA glycosylase
VRFHHGPRAPEWWSRLPPSLTSPEFTLERLQAFLQRRARSPLKGVLLDQAFFIGVGNWMADEILWRAKIHPRHPAGQLSAAETRSIWTVTRLVCEGALRIVATDFAVPPASWLFRHRWEKGGSCPKDGSELARATVGGRTTAWCPKCQPK